MTDQDAIRSSLESERAQLQGRLDEIHAGRDAALDFDEGFADSAQVSAEQGENRALAGQLERELADIDAALASLDAGTYGTCTVCGTAIGATRLEAMPATQYCIDHA